MALMRLFGRSALLWIRSCLDGELNAFSITPLTSFSNFYCPEAAGTLSETRLGFFLLKCGRAGFLSALASFSTAAPGLSDYFCCTGVP